jgi:hypothetical protein
MTIAAAAKTALDVQDACNLSGVVSTFQRILTEVLWPEARANGHGTDWVNQHPISVLFADKIMSLSRHEAAEVLRSWDICETLASLPSATVAEEVAA